MTGFVASIEPNRRYGFIKATGYVKDIFFHKMSLIDGTTMDDIREGVELSFDVEDSPKGARAERVCLRDE